MSWNIFFFLLCLPSVIAPLSCQLYSCQDDPAMNWSGLFTKIVCVCSILNVASWKLPGIGTVYFIWCFWNLVSSTLNVAVCKLPAFQAISMPSCGGIFHGFLPLYSGPVLGNYTPLKVIPDISSSYMGPTVSYFTILGFELIPVRD